MAKNTGDPRGPGMPGSGGWTEVGQGREEVVITNPSGDVGFDYDYVQPIRGVYVRADDVLQAQILSNAAVNVQLTYRILTRSQGVVLGQSVLVNAGGRTSQLFSQQMAEGFLLSVVATPVSALTAAQYAFISVGLRRQSQSVVNLVDVLAQGYASQASPVAFPQGPLQRSTDGLGILRSITGAVPAAGVDISETVPTGARWQLLSLRASLASAVAAANRQPKLTLDDGANRFYDTADGPAQAASLTWAYAFAPIGFAPTNTLTDVVIGYDNAQLLGAGFRVKTVTAAIQAADQWTAPQYVVREWQEMN